MVTEGATAHPWYRDESGQCHCFSVSEATKAGLKLATNQLPLLIDLMRMADWDQSIDSAVFHFAKGTTITLSAPDPTDRAALWASLHRLYALARRTPLPWWPSTHEIWSKQKEFGDPCAEMELSFQEQSNFGEHLAGKFATDLAFRGLDDIFNWPGPQIDSYPSASEALGMDNSSFALALCEFIDGWWQSAIYDEGEA